MTKDWNIADVPYMSGGQSIQCCKSTKESKHKALQVGELQNKMSTIALPLIVSKVCTNHHLLEPVGHSWHWPSLTGLPWSKRPGPIMSPVEGIFEKGAIAWSMWEVRSWQRCWGAWGWGCQVQGLGQSWGCVFAMTWPLFNLNSTNTTWQHCC